MKFTAFENYVRSFYTGEDPAEMDLPALLHCNKIALGKIMTKPETARQGFLIKLSNLLEVSPYQLIAEWNVAVNHLSKEEIDFYRELHEDENDKDAA